MESEDRVPIRYRPQNEPGEPRESRERRGISTRGIIGLVIVAALLIVGAVGAVKWTQAQGEQQAAKQTEALKTAWEKNQKLEAQGVDFEMTVKNSEIKRAPELSFSHSGTVTAKDRCFKATSDYIVLQDGSLAIRNLSRVSNSGSECASSGSSPIFFASKLTFKGKSWTAYGADGKELLSGLKENSSEGSSSGSSSS